MSRRRFSVFGVVILVLFTSSCTSFVQASVNTLAAAQGFIAQAQVNHQVQCQANPSLQFPCVTINQAVVAQNVAVSALEVYCQLPVAPDLATLKALGTKTCNANPNSKQILVSALANLGSVLSYYKSQSGGKP
jgi:hypothetical protein